MGNRYKVLLPILVDGEYGQGDMFEKNFDDNWTVGAEQANIDSGLLELQPNTYKVIGTSNVLEHKPGETFEAVVTKGVEELLIAGGHIERLPDKKASSKPSAKQTETKGEN